MTRNDAQKTSGAVRKPVAPVRGLQTKVPAAMAANPVQVRGQVCAMVP